MTMRAALVAVPVLALAVFLVLGPIPQPLAYHDFADSRAFIGVPNFANVTSNLAFLLAGGLGLYITARHRPAGARAAWTVFFLGFVLVAFGSAYYHLSPNNPTLVWDRAAMAVGFTGAYVALVCEYVHPGLERRLLPVALVASMASVLYWAWTDDVGPYFAVQATVFSSAALILAALHSVFRDKPLIIAAFASYAVAIALEQFDGAVFVLTQGVTGGHGLKHLFAGLAAGWVCLMLARRGAAGESA